MCGGHLGNIWIKQQQQWVGSTAPSSSDLALDLLLVLSGSAVGAESREIVRDPEVSRWSSCATKDTGVLVSVMMPFT